MAAEILTTWVVHRIEYPRGEDVSFEIRSGRKLIVQTIMRDIATESDLIAEDEANVYAIVNAIRSHRG